MNLVKKRQIRILDLSPPVLVGGLSKRALGSMLGDQGWDVEYISIDMPDIRRDFFSQSLRSQFFSFLKVFRDFARGLVFLLKIFLSIKDNRNTLISKILDAKYEGLVIGDCIMSAYFRKNSTPLIPKKSPYLMFFILGSFIYAGYQLRYLRQKCSSISTDNTYSFNSETTGFPEIWRRFLISEKIGEVRYSIFHQGFRLFGEFTGVDLRKGVGLREGLYAEVTDAQIKIGRETIKSLVTRHIQYAYLKDADVDITVQLRLPPFPPKETIILFLATLSDAQYLYGVGPYGDLHSFHEEVINSALNCGYRVVIKPHPAMFKDKQYALKDRNYYQYLRKQWKPTKFSECVLRSEVNKSLFFVDAKLSVIELSKVFPNYMCVTQHGSVAAECAYLDLFCLVGANSQFFDGDLFVRRLSNSDQIEDVFKDWQKFSGHSQRAKSALFKYTYVNNNKCELLYETRLFPNLIPPNIDSGMVDVWVKSYLTRNPSTGYDDLLNACKQFIQNQDNDFDTVISK